MYLRDRQKELRKPLGKSKEKKLKKFQKNS